VVVDGNPAPVVPDAGATVTVQGHTDFVATTGHDLIDGVVDELVEHMVVSVPALGVPDEHSRASAHGFKAFLNLDFLAVVSFRDHFYPSLSGASFYIGGEKTLAGKKYFNHIKVLIIFMPLFHVERQKSAAFPLAHEFRCVDPSAAIQDERQRMFHVKHKEEMEEAGNSSWDVRKV
jgi:hypothetical protein